MMMWLECNESSITTCCNSFTPARISVDGERYTDTTHNWDFLQVIKQHTTLSNRQEFSTVYSQIGGQRDITE